MGIRRFAGFGACFMLPSPVIVEAEASAECASAPMATPAAAPTMTIAVWLAVRLPHDGAIAAARRGVQCQGGVKAGAVCGWGADECRLPGKSGYLALVRPAVTPGRLSSAR